MATESYQNDIDQVLEKVRANAGDRPLDVSGQRKMPMRVLCLGMGRTGTTCE